MRVRGAERMGFVWRGHRRSHGLVVRRSVCSNTGNGTIPFWFKGVIAEFRRGRREAGARADWASTAARAGATLRAANLMAAQRRRIAVVGGGAAGFFGAIRCAETAAGAADVALFEATAHPLAKVRVSGGGRCNVTHACADLREFVASYPRGGRELLGPLHRFGPRETIAWFAQRGVALKTEADGRMFPITDDSATIVECLRQAAERAGVRVVTRCAVSSVTRAEDAFRLELATGETVLADRLLLATGGNQSSRGIAIARSLGHEVAPQVPSLFTFHIDDARLRSLEGLSVAEAGVSVPGTKLRASGAVLVTHWGLSGPAILRLSAWGARELAAAGYKFAVTMNWVHPRNAAEVAAELSARRAREPRKHVGSANPFNLPARLWERLVAAAEISPSLAWAGLSNAAAQTLAAQLAQGRFVVAGKSANKEEFVTCGGVSLREVDFHSMESRLCPGLFLAGEILDIDGLTGGFNFQSAWTTGWLGGTAIAAR